MNTLKAFIDKFMAANAAADVLRKSDPRGASAASLRETAVRMLKKSRAIVMPTTIYDAQARAMSPRQHIVERFFMNTRGRLPINRAKKI